MIELVDISSASNFVGNPLAEQHKLRYRSVIERQKWDVPHHNGLEYDEYDNPAAKYLIYRDKLGIARGVSRFYSTHLPYMLEEKFPHFVTKIQIPKDEKIWEGSRYCIDHKISPKTRQDIINQLGIAYLEMGLNAGIDGIVGLTYPVFWKKLFIDLGWPIEFIGDVTKLDNGHKAQAAWLPVSQAILDNVREVTGIYETVLYLGINNDNKKAA
ncbi:MAG: hypothetical protein COA45_12295 [Zetaproteobacteria bacterium]|nr:MAG: hypothetical protein COA45_12295 [Zetaproteobacteria bacterium]